MDPTLLTVLGVILGAGATLASVAYQSARQQRVREDELLWNERLAAYKALWQITRAFPKTPDTQSGGGTVDTVVDELNTWYFSGGGLLLSRSTRDAYFELLGQLAASKPDVSTTNIHPDPYQELYEKANKLRRNMASDVGTHRKTDHYHEFG